MLFTLGETSGWKEIAGQEDFDFDCFTYYSTYYIYEFNTHTIHGPALAGMKGENKECIPNKF